MRRVIGIGETILDVIFRNEQPIAAVPGGSVFNGIITLGRLGANVAFVGDAGGDRIGKKILQFMQDSGVSTEFISIFPDGKSPISLSYLDENNNVDALYYKDYPNQRLDGIFPRINEDDIVVFGSYFSLNPALREKVLELLEQAREKKAIVYYDPNFRDSHRNEAMKLAPSIIENLEYSDIVCGSRQDFINMYNMDDADKVYKAKIAFYCRNFICTDGPGNIALRTATLTKSYAATPVEVVSTMGAGDNFNAGILYGLLKHDIRHRDLQRIEEHVWDKIIKYAIDFSAEVCRGYDNSLAREFTEGYRL